ncbi:MAG: RDD family protein [Acidimicrobiia bacterium]|nr:RDD family protein [Acidimicrobiia bacterium]
MGRSGHSTRVTPITDAFGNVAEDWHGYYAGFGSRLMAYIVDGAVILVGFYLLVGLCVLVVAIATLERPNSPALPDVVWLVLFVVWSTLYLTYTVGVFGKTVGKALVGLRVVSRRGERVGIARAFFRVPAYLVSYLVFGLGFVWIVLSRTRRGWHDYLVGTCVIYDWDARRGPAPRRPVSADARRPDDPGDLAPSTPSLVDDAVCWPANEGRLRFRDRHANF